MKILKLLLALILTSGILFACDSADEEQQSEVTEIQIEVIISLENGEEVIEEEELTINAGQNLMEVMEDNFDVVNEGGLLMAINDIRAEGDQPYSWFYTINGEHAMTGAADYIVEDGDLIEFDFHSWE